MVSVCTRTYPTNCKTYDRQNKSEKQAADFLENTAFFLQREIVTARQGHMYFKYKKGCRQICILRHPNIFRFIFLIMYFVFEYEFEVFQDLT